MPKWPTREWIFTLLSLSVSGVFGWGFFTVAGLPPTTVGESWPLLLMFVVFFTMPFAKKLDLFQFISFEAKISEVRREVEETKGKVSDIREDVRHVIAQQNAISASFLSMNQQAVTVNNYDRPPQEQLEVAAAQVANVEPIVAGETDPLLKELSQEKKLLQAIFGNWVAPKAASDDGVAYADLLVDIDDFNELRKISMSESVAVLRIRIERELKRLMRGADLDAGGSQRHPLSAREMIRHATRLYPNLAGQSESFDVFFRIANAAVHADDVPKKDLDTALYLGERLLSLLTKIAPE